MRKVTTEHMERHGICDKRRRSMEQNKLLHEKETYAILGACFEVYKEMGCGFTEAIYQECLEYEFEDCKIPYLAQKELPLKYRDRILKKKFKPDFICYDKIIVEIKAVSSLNDEFRSQALNYLNATDIEICLLIKMEEKLIILSERYEKLTRYLCHEIKWSLSEPKIILNSVNSVCSVGKNG